MEELNLVAGRSRSKGFVEYLHLNLASFRCQCFLLLQFDQSLLQSTVRISYYRSVSNFVTAFNKKKLPLHLLANNAAVWMVEDQMTEDGFEVKGCMQCMLTIDCQATKSQEGAPSLGP